MRRDAVPGESGFEMLNRSLRTLGVGAAFTIFKPNRSDLLDELNMHFREQRPVLFPHFVAQNLFHCIVVTRFRGLEIECHDPATGLSDYRETSSLVGIWSGDLAVLH
jgi:hypothetical protein